MNRALEKKRGFNGDAEIKYLNCLQRFSKINIMGENKNVRNELWLK